MEPRLLPCGRHFRAASALVLLFAAPLVSEGAVINGDPGNYLAQLATLAPGDTLQLAAGTYVNGLPIQNMNGVACQPIAIAGPASGPAALFQARPCCNTVSLVDSSYIEIRNLTLDGLGMAGIDAVKAESVGAFAHHITIENLTIVNHGGDQQTIGISTKCPAWNWEIRSNIVIGAGTGLYLGDSTGAAPFVAGVVEYNLVQDPIGYAMQIKHQNDRTTPGMPASAKTVIRHNVFSKANGGSTGVDARPNLLVGHWPLSGPGASDVYEIYGNFFHQNPNEGLFQGEGNVALYDNLFLNDFGSAVAIQPQNDVPKLIRVFNNTVVATGTGIRVTGGDLAFTQSVIANASFAATPYFGGTQIDNVADTYAAAAVYVQNPSAPLGSFDLYPRLGTLTGAPVDTASFQQFENWDRDFNGSVHGGSFRGAYAGEGVNPGWLPRLERKPATGGAAMLLADLDQDGLVNAGDSVILSNYLVGNLTSGAPPFTAPLAAADLDQSGTVSAVDSVVLANYLVGNISCLPV